MSTETKKKKKKKKRAPLTVGKLAETWIAEAAYWFAARTLLDSLTAKLRNKMYGAGEQNLASAADVIRGEIYRRETDAWRTASMFGIAAGAETREEIQQLAYDRFLSEPMSIIGYLTPSMQPTSWSGKAEEELRALVDQAFGRPSTIHGRTEEEAGRLFEDEEDEEEV